MSEPCCIAAAHGQACTCRRRLEPYTDPAMMPATYPAVRTFLDRHILVYIDDHDTNGFDWLAFNLRAFTNDWITRDMASAICKSLRDRGYLTYERGLWTEDGEPGGSGYAITRAGREYLRSIEHD